MEDDNEKIRKAVEILDNYSVGKNLTYFVDSLWHEAAEGFEWERGFKAPDVPKVARAVRFIFRGKAFELVASDRQHGYETSTSKFTLTVDGDTVLTSVMHTTSDEMFSFHSVSISTYELKQVKIGEWMEELAEARRLTSEAGEVRKKRREAEEAAKKAAEIDLGKYG